MLCRERLARLSAAAQPAGATPTFSPAVNERSLRLALSKQIRELLDEVPAFQRLGAACRRPPRSDAGEDMSLPWRTPQACLNTRVTTKWLLFLLSGSAGVLASIAVWYLHKPLRTLVNPSTLHIAARNSIHTAFWARMRSG